MLPLQLTPVSMYGCLLLLITQGADNFGAQWICSPACTELENVTMDWAANLYGLSKDFYNSTNVGGGVIQVSVVP